MACCAVTCCHITVALWHPVGKTVFCRCSDVLGRIALALTKGLVLVVAFKGNGDSLRTKCIRTPTAESKTYMYMHYYQIWYTTLLYTNKGSWELHYGAHSTIASSFQCIQVAIHCDHISKKDHNQWSKKALKLLENIDQWVQHCCNLVLLDGVNDHCTMSCHQKHHLYDWASFYMQAWDPHYSGQTGAQVGNTVLLDISDGPVEIVTGMFTPFFSFCRKYWWSCNRHWVVTTDQSHGHHPPACIGHRCHLFYHHGCWEMWHKLYHGSTLSRPFPCVSGLFPWPPWLSVNSTTEPPQTSPINHWGRYWQAWSKLQDYPICHVYLPLHICPFICWGFCYPLLPWLLHQFPSFWSPVWGTFARNRLARMSPT